MQSALIVIVAVLVAYAIGSIPFGVLIARARGVDLRAVGSGNIGATNAARALGKPLGALVFLLDAIKGYASIVLGALLMLPAVPVEVGPWALSGVGFAAFVGHLTTPWLGFRGGKGVATAFGLFLAISPLASAIALGVYVLAYVVTRISSLSSLVAATAFLPAMWAVGGDVPAAQALGVAVWALIVLRHRENIGRLLRREEPRV